MQKPGIALNTSYPAAYAVKALALQGIGRNTEALAATDQALALDPGNAHYWHVKGILLAAGGNCTGAREALERSLDLDPDYTLPWPGFSGARESLAAMNSSCTPGTQSPVTSANEIPGGRDDRGYRCYRRIDRNQNEKITIFCNKNIQNSLSSEGWI